MLFRSDPQQLIDRYGADTARLFVMFAAPPEQTLEWNDAGVEGAHRFLKRVWVFGARYADALRASSAIDGDPAALAHALALSDSEVQNLRREFHAVLRQVSFDYERMQYNTVASGAMKLLNALEGLKDADGSAAQAARREGFGILLRVLHPACPHLTHGLWQALAYADTLGDLLDAPWPQVDEAALVQDRIELALQVNGKLRGTLVVDADADQATIEAAALASEAFVKFADGKSPRKVIVVVGRLVNVVV